MRITFTVPGKPVAKPRMTQRDKFPPVRPCVKEYWEFKDAVFISALGAGYRHQRHVVEEVYCEAFISMPKSWSQKKKSAMRGKQHQQTPDFDNILKAVCDSLAADDKAIWSGGLKKRWDDGDGPRIIVRIEVLEA